MLSCKELAQQHASAHIDGELQGRLRWSVRLHLVLCGHCRRFVRQLGIVRKLLKSLPETPVTDEVELSRMADHLYKLHEHKH